ncbi:MAG TPA: hypothetical protein VFJ16_15485 [Longimicrobium sp.]|nr:hypothetical protein [Longimicrobium sp.]
MPAPLAPSRRTVVTPLLAAIAAAGVLGGCTDRGQPLAAPGRPGAPHARADVVPLSTDVFAVAHQDDWQLFMGDRTAAAYPGADRVLFIFTTAGDAGNPDTTYWKARERGALAAADSVAGGGGAWSCAPAAVHGHAIRRCARGKSAAYFLRVGDGNSGTGLGFGRGSLGVLRDLGTPVTALDSSTTYASWSDLSTTLRAIVDMESGGGPVRMHVHDWNRAANPGDHPDHAATGDAVNAARAGAGWTVTGYAGYDTGNRPANLDSAGHVVKLRALAGYDAAMVASGAGSVLGNSDYQGWLWRTYARPDVPVPPPPPPPTPPAPTGSTFATDFHDYGAGYLPGGWTQPWDPGSGWLVVADSTATGGQALRWSSTGASRNRWGLAFGGFGDVGDQSVYTELRVQVVPAASGVRYMGAAAVRMGGIAADEHGYAVFLVDNRDANARSLVLSTWSNGQYVQLQDVPLAWSENTWYAVRLRAEGGRLRAKVWPRGTAEPGGWAVDVYDTRYPVGRPGVSNHDNGTVTWDAWSVDVSPAPPPPAGQSWSATFTGGPSGAVPAGWTATSAPGNVAWAVAADLTVPDGRVLRGTSLSTGRHILQLDSFPAATNDQEALTRLRLLNGDDYGPGLAVRHSMNGTAENAYVAYLRPNSGLVEIDRFKDGGWQFVASAPFASTPGSWYWIRFAALGSQLRARVWADGQAEPQGWTVQGNDAGLTAGTVGVYVYEPNAVDFDLFSAASQGGTAPTPAQPGPPPALAHLVVTPGSATVATGAQATFAAYGVLANGDSVAVPGVAWTATGGAVTQGGVFTGGTAGGAYQVVATAPGGVADTAEVTVVAPPPSTVFSTGFTGGAAGTAPAGWTATSAPANVTWTVEADASAADGRVLRGAATSTARHILRADALGTGVGTQEVLVRMRFANGNTYGPGVAVRHTMNGTSESAYVLYFRPNAGDIEMDRFLNGGWAWMGSAGFASSPNTWYWIRFRAEGSTLRGRVWADGSAEPAGWTLTVTDGALSTGGLGVYIYEPNTVLYDGFSGVDGPATAPAP